MGADVNDAGSTPRHARRPRAVALAVVAVLGGLAAWLVVSRGTGDEPAREPIAVTEQGLRELAAAGAIVFWAGPRAGFTYELTQEREGQVRLRYLPPGASVGDGEQRYLSVGTYVFEGAYDAMRKAAEESDARLVDVPGGGVAFAAEGAGTSAYLSEPGANYQVEVYSPGPGEALRLVTDGRITRVG